MVVTDPLCYSEGRVEEHSSTFLMVVSMKSSHDSVPAPLYRERTTNENWLPWASCSVHIDWTFKLQDCGLSRKLSLGLWPVFETG